MAETPRRRMPEPTATLQWTFEGYREVWLYDGTKGSREDFREFASAAFRAIEHAETVADLGAAIEGVADEHNLTAEVNSGGSHLDPGRNYVTVGVFTKGSEPPTGDPRSGRRLVT